MKVAKNAKPDPEIVERLKTHKAEILDFLSAGMGDLQQIKNLGPQIQPYDRAAITEIPLSFRKNNFGLLIS